MAATETNTDDDMDALVGAVSKEALVDADAIPITGTFSGNRGLQIEEPLIFEQDAPGPHRRRPAGAADGQATASAASSARAPIGLPGLSEPQVVRHFTRLSQKNYAIDIGLYPLGSCTMKHNPRLNEKMARLPGLADLHPLQPVIDGAGRARADRQAGALAEDADRHAGGRACRPAAGAHGELCGMMAIRAALEATRRESPQAHPGAGIGARHQSGDGRRPAATRSIRSRPTRAAASISPRSRRSSAPMSPAS